MTFKEKFANLVDVKTIVTFIVIGVFSYLAVREKIDVGQVMSVVIMIITFFFAKPATPNESGTTTTQTTTTDSTTETTTNLPQIED